MWGVTDTDSTMGQGLSFTSCQSKPIQVPTLGASVPLGASKPFQESMKTMTEAETTRNQRSIIKAFLKADAPRSPQAWSAVPEKGFQVAPVTKGEFPMQGRIKSLFPSSICRKKQWVWLYCSCSGEQKGVVFFFLLLHWILFIFCLLQSTRAARRQGERHMASEALLLSPCHPSCLPAGCTHRNRWPLQVMAPPDW